MDKKILICSGGTGGHIYPALALAKELDANYQVNLHFAGGKLSKNKWFQKDLFDFTDITSATLSLKDAPKIFVNIFKIFKGTIESIRLIREYRPDLIIAFGSFHTFPTLIAALICRKTIYLHEQNKMMGRVNRLFSRWAKKIMVSFPSTFPEVKKKALLVKMPLKFSQNDLLSKKDARKKLGLDRDLKTILVCGGSQGALSINQTFLESLKHLEGSSFQVIHLIGFNEDIEKVKEEYKKYNVKALVKVFDEKMHILMLASNFMVSRAGALSVAEMIELKLPAIMIPYPYAKAHQEHNADFVEQTVQGGLKISEAYLNDLLLAKAMMSFFNDETISHYMHHIESYKQKTKLSSFADIVSLDLNLHGKK